MKKIGILGGMGPESTVLYYQNLTRSYIATYGNDNFPEIIIYSITQQKNKDFAKCNDWSSVADYLGKAAQSLEKAGADFILISANTNHKVLPEIQSQIRIPVLSILDSVGQEIKRNGFTKVGLLGTKTTMQEDFYPKVFQKYGISILYPSLSEQDLIQRVIFEELHRNIISDYSRIQFIKIIDSLANQGAQGVILGCTEIPLLINQKDTPVPVFDSMLIHTRDALRVALGEIEI